MRAYLAWSRLSLGSEQGALLKRSERSAVPLPPPPAAKDRPHRCLLLPSQPHALLAMLAPKEVVKTAPAQNPTEFDLANIRHAIFQAEQGLREKGVPIGAALVRNDGVVIGVGRNRRVQLGSATRHGEVR